MALSPPCSRCRTRGAPASFRERAAGPGGVLLSRTVRSVAPTKNKNPEESYIIKKKLGEGAWRPAGRAPACAGSKDGGGGRRLWCVPSCRGHQRRQRVRLRGTMAAGLHTSCSLRGSYVLKRMRCRDKEEMLEALKEARPARVAARDASRS
jgi:hypothetical protein